MSLLACNLAVMVMSQLTKLFTLLTLCCVKCLQYHNSLNIHYLIVTRGLVFLLAWCALNCKAAVNLSIKYGAIMKACLKYRPSRQTSRQIARQLDIYTNR